MFVGRLEEREERYKQQREVLVSSSLICLISERVQLVFLGDEAEGDRAREVYLVDAPRLFIRPWKKAWRFSVSMCGVDSMASSVVGLPGSGDEP